MKEKQSLNKSNQKFLFEGQGEASPLDHFIVATNGPHDNHGFTPFA